MGDDGIVLTDREREALAGLAESIGDPWLARQLAGPDPVPPPPRRRLPPRRDFASAVHRATAGWIGVLLLLAGAALAVATFVRSTLVASLGLLVMGFGAWCLTVDRIGTPPAEPPAG